jgi:nucleoside-diphosphate-sugar epimerase/predicted dehydrogenase
MSAAAATMQYPSQINVPRRDSRKDSVQRVALLGTGYIAEWHAKALARVDGVQLAAVCDQVLPRANAFAEKFAVQAVYDNLEAMLASEELEAVHVLLPPDLHFRAADSILKAGVSVLLEKPMCTRSDECDALIRRAAAQGLRLGVGHNFLFADPYEQLRCDLRGGIFGPIDSVTISWNRELGQLRSGPYDIWMLRDPRNIMLEIGSHPATLLLDAIGEPTDISVKISNPVTMPNGQNFYRRWQVNAFVKETAAELNFSFVPGYPEYSMRVRGLMASATVDFERNSYVLMRHRPFSEDFERYVTNVAQTRDLRRQARRTLLEYLGSKLHLPARGNPYAASIIGALKAFYSDFGTPPDERIRATTGAAVVRVCEAIAQSAPVQIAKTVSAIPAARFVPSPRILILGATGFIGQELSRKLVESGHSVRLLARSASKLPAPLRSSATECLIGDVNNEADLRKALDGIDCVYHIARSNVKTWADYQRHEIEATRRIAELALAAKVKRFIYTGTIDSYYAGARAGTITEESPLDPRISRRNLYARAKAASEELLSRMHRERGLPLVILRPGIVIGRGGSPFHWGVGTWWYQSICEIWGKGENKLPLVLVDDVADGLIASMEKPGIEGQSFNLIGDALLSAQEYLDELNRCGDFQVERHATPIIRFYLTDLFKWMVKVMVRHPERQLPSYRDWESRTQLARFDCSKAKTILGWRPVADKEELVRRGIRQPLLDAIR